MGADSAGLVEAEPYLVHLHVNDLPKVWGAIEPVLRKACEDSRGMHTVENVLAQMGLHDGVERWRLLAIIDHDQVQAVMVVRVEQQLDGKRRLHCMMAGGERSGDWPSVDPEFDALAREWGCTAVRIDCARKGWAKKLPHWSIIGYVMEREI